MVETIPAPPVSAPRYALPAGACDAHSHVFGPHDRFRPTQPTIYALPDATQEVQAATRARLGVARGVLTQPAPYGTDPSAMLEALRGSGGALLGIAVAAPDVTDATLEDWHAAGIRGLRFTEVRAPGGGRYPGSIGLDALRDLAPRMRDLGWHAQIWASAADMPALLPAALGHGIPLVLDHMGMPDPARGTDDPGFAAIRAALRDGRLWVKLTTCRIKGDARPFHDALIAANPDRLLWGSDWPYVRMDPPPDAGVLLDRFHEWTAEEALRHRILVDNPARLYGF
ncbi:amidohydrolase family protein [Roseomonas sp. CCTCC AB2023176]|uniref:amidohydrolase family protein n=1 Tax=Roseomonas sp. CCTCC AB2023176 TaxID=3342640 RepID=UPI0035DC5731